MNIAHDLAQALLVVFGTLGGVMTLLFTLAALDPQTDYPGRGDRARSRRARSGSTRRVRGGARRRVRRTRAFVVRGTRPGPAVGREDQVPAAPTGASEGRLVGTARYLDDAGLGAPR